MDMYALQCLEEINLVQLNKAFVPTNFKTVPLGLP